MITPALCLIVTDVTKPFVGIVGRLLNAMGVVHVFVVHVWIPKPDNVKSVRNIIVRVVRSLSEKAYVRGVRNEITLI